jgi:very-short-patch-repair endonuclease
MGGSPPFQDKGTYMKVKRFQYEFRENASKGHKRVGNLLRNGQLQNWRIYQEYPVKQLFPEYYNGQHKYDWVILDLQIIIEIHGEQHYYVVDFGKEGQDKARERFRKGKERDNNKRRIALQNEWKYIEIPYWEVDKITEEELLEKIL